MTIHGTFRRWRTVIMLAALLPLAACMTPPVEYSERAVQPAVCTDSTYQQLRRQNPDSLSERAWQRLQRLDRQCVTASEQWSERDARRGMMGMGYGGAPWMIGMGAMALMMVAMMWRR